MAGGATSSLSSFSSTYSLSEWPPLVGGGADLKSATPVRGGSGQLLRRPQASPPPSPTTSPPHDVFPPPMPQGRSSGLQFLPHALLPPRRPTTPLEPPVMEPPRPPPAPEPVSPKILQKPAKKFRVPVPLNLPPGPWLPEDIIPVAPRPAVGVNEIDSPPDPYPRRNLRAKSEIESSRWRNRDSNGQWYRNNRYQGWQTNHSTHFGPPASRGSFAFEPARPQPKQKVKKEWVTKRRQVDQKASSGDGGSGDGLADPSSMSGGIQSDLDELVGKREKHKQKFKKEWVVKRGQDDQKASSEEMSRSENETSNCDGSTEPSSENGEIQTDLDEYVGEYDLAIDDVEEGDSSERELGMQKEVEDFNSEKDDITEVDVLAIQLADSMILTSDIARDNADSKFQIAGSDSFKEQPALSQWGIDSRYMDCRADIETLTAGFLSVYESLIPSEKEKNKQIQLIDSLAKSVKKEWPSAHMFIYGSRANTFGFSSSDIDVCLAIDDNSINKHDMLLKLVEILRSDDFCDVEAVLNARVPVVKIIDPETSIACDICVNNILAIENTKLLKDYAKIDVRLHQLAFIVKHWAKSRGLNDTYRGTLSSYAYVLMCIHFLQLRKPSILPCLQEMEATYTVTIDDFQCAYFDDIEALSKSGAQNSESLARLVWEFFHYWAYEHDYKNHVISVRTGRVISKKSKNWTTKTVSDHHLLSIEDPFETSHDLGRRVDRGTLRILREEFKRAASILQDNSNPPVVIFEQFSMDSNGSP